MDEGKSRPGNREGGVGSLEGKHSGSVRIGDYLLKIMKVENKVIQTVLAIPLPKEEKK